MAGRVFTTGQPWDSGTTWSTWFEIRPGEFVLGENWKEIALYVAHWENRGANIATQRLAWIRDNTPHPLVEITDVAS